MPTTGSQNNMQLQGRTMGYGCNEKQQHGPLYRGMTAKDSGNNRAANKQKNQRRRAPRATMLQNRLRASISSPEESNCCLANLRETPSKQDRKT